MQPFLADEHAIPSPEGSVNRAQQLTMTQGADEAYALAKNYGVNLACAPIYSLTLRSPKNKTSN